MTLDYFYGDQAEQFSFYRIPKALFTDSMQNGCVVSAHHGNGVERPNRPISSQFPFC